MQCYVKNMALYSGERKTQIFMQKPQNVTLQPGQLQESLQPQNEFLQPQSQASCFLLYAN